MIGRQPQMIPSVFRGSLWYAARKIMHSSSDGCPLAVQNHVKTFAPAGLRPAREEENIAQASGNRYLDSSRTRPCLRFDGPPTEPTRCSSIALGKVLRAGGCAECYRQSS